jgi:hypothetical protein
MIRRGGHRHHQAVTIVATGVDTAREAMMPTIKRSLVVAAIAAMGVFASVGTVHAAQASLRPVGHAAHGPAIQGLQTPKNSNILPRDNRSVPYKFMPSHMRVPDCNNPLVSYSLTITNDTAVDQTIDEAGVQIDTIPAGSSQAYCANGAGVQVVYLDGTPSATLQIDTIR